MDKVSIVVPIYNVEGYLKKCVESILNQTYKNLEIILVDDESPDRCPNICDEYAQKDKRIKVIHKKNGGLSDARNAGINIATGKFISFIDSDDYIDENYINTLYKLCIENKVDIAECDFLRFKDESEIRNQLNKKYKYENKVIDNREMMKRMFSKKKSIRTTVVWNKLYKKTLFDEIKFPKGKLHEDEFTTYKIIFNSKKIALTDKKMYFYRQNDRSIMGEMFNEKRYDALDAFRERKEFFERKKEEKFFYKADNRYQSKIINFYCLTRKYINNSIKQQNELIKLARNNFHNMNRKIKYKIKFILFDISPNKYYYIWRILRKKYNP